MSDKPCTETSKTSKEKVSSVKLNKTVLNLSDAHKTRVDNALALLSNQDRTKAIKNAYELGKTVVQENGMTLANLTQRVKKGKKKRAKGSKSPDPLAGSNSITVRQSSIEESVDRLASNMEDSIIEQNTEDKEDKNKEGKSRKKSKKKRNQKHNSVASSIARDFLDKSMPPELKEYILRNYGTSYGSPLNLVATNSRSILAGPKTSAKSKISEKPKRPSGEGNI
jgi:hypothetical protein